jgi:hypothetical protein
LDQTKTDGLSESVLFNAEADGVAAVNSVYNQLHQNHIDFVIKGIWYDANFLSQDVHNWGADIAFNTFEIPTTFASTEQLWINCYIGIARANQTLVELQSMKSRNVTTEAMANRLIGECLFLRGFYYTLLGSNFGNVPLILTATPTGQEGQSTQDEIFTSVAADMKQAADYLPWSYDAANIGRAAKGAALGYLGEAYLWLKDYTNAEVALQQVHDYAVANPTIIGLEPHYWDIHDLSHENGIESLFAIQYTTPEARDWNRPNDCQWLQDFTMPDEVNGTGYAYADKKLYDAYLPGDKRKIASVIGPGDQHPTCPINSYPKITDGIAIKVDSVDYNINTCGTLTHPWNRAGRSGYYVMKFWRLPESVIDGYRSSQMFSELNLILLRYGQVVIDLAEAKWHNSKTGEATTLLKEIRNRAWEGTAPDPIGMDAQTFVNEYRLEVAGEFSFWYILRRMGEDINFVKNTYGITIPAGKNLMPIPQGQIDVNKHLVQNPGY